MKLKFYKVIKRETKTGINFRVKPVNTQHPFGFKELEGDIQSENIEQAADLLKRLIKNSLEQRGFSWGKRD